MNLTTHVKDHMYLTAGQTVLSSQKKCGCPCMCGSSQNADTTTNTHMISILSTCYNCNFHHGKHRNNTMTLRLGGINHGGNNPGDSIGGAETQTNLEEMHYLMVHVEKNKR
jgi:hypothetical protein